jgi:hypothetical protein
MKPIIINFPKIQDPRGNLTFCNILVKYLVIQRTFGLMICLGEKRWTCVLRTKEIIVALSGDFDVVINADGSIENFL